MSRVAELAQTSMQREAGQGAIFDLKVNYISPDDGAHELKATSRIVHAGRRTIVTECHLQTADGRLVATASATFAVTGEKE